MTTSELKNKIAGLENSEWFKSASIDFALVDSERNKNLTGFSAIFEYFCQQVDGWQKLGNTIPSQLEASKSFFETGKQLVIEFINRFHEHAHNSLVNHWNNYVGRLAPGNKKIFTYDSPETEFLIGLNNSYPQFLPGAFSFLMSDSGFDLHNKNNFIGANLAYEFVLQDHSKIIERRNAEKASISRIRNDFHRYLSNSEAQVIEHLEEINKKYEEYVKIIDDLKKQKEDLFNQWFDDAEKNKNDLENTYRELLRLKEPADYWKKRAEALRKQAWKSTCWLIVLVAFSAISLFILLWLTPEGMLLSFVKDSALAIKWSIIFIAFLSFLAYGIRILAKISFSAFHLARDAEEREQLTYLYLSLRKDGNVDEKDRQYVLQSLFSRAETGLLKDDSSPTMPGTGSVIEKFISKQ